MYKCCVMPMDISRKYNYGTGRLLKISIKVPRRCGLSYVGERGGRERGRGNQ